MDLGLAVPQHLAPSVHLGVPRLLQWLVSPLSLALAFPFLSGSRRNFAQLCPLCTRAARWVVIPLYLIYDSGKVILSALDRQQEGKKTA